MNKILTVIIAVAASLTIMSAQETSKVKMYARGYRADIELSAAVANQYTISTSQGFSIGNGLYVGGGVGFATELEPEYSSKPVFLVPLFADFKYSFLNQKCSPFVGMRAGEMIDITKNGLRILANPSAGVDISRFSIKIGYELQYGVMGAGEGLMNHYAKIGIGFVF